MLAPAKLSAQRWLPAPPFDPTIKPNQIPHTACKTHGTREVVIDRLRKGDYTEKWMEVRFRDPCYDQLEVDPHYSGGWPPAVVKAYRSRLNYIRQAQDERDLYSWRSLRMEKLQGSRQHQHSLRLNDQWRLVIEFEGNSPKKTIVIVNIEDYH